jgi:hypothetical protein
MQSMNVLWSVVLTSLLSFTCLPNPGHAAGWVITMRTSKGQTTLYLDETLGAKMSQSGMDMISRTDQQRMYQVNATQGTYVVMDWDAFRRQRQRATTAMQERLQHLSPQQRAAIQQQMTQLQQQLQNLPAEQRAHVEKMLQQLMGMQDTPPPPPKITYQKTGQSQTINGFKTWQVIKYKNDQRDQELWVAAVKNWRRIGKTWKNAFDVFIEDKDDLPFEEVGGLPIRMIDDQDVTEVLSISQRSFTAGDFSPPDGARQVSPMEMMGPRRR